MGRKYFQTELLDLNNKENYRFIVDLLFHCEKPVSPDVEYAYYQEFGHKDKFEEVKKRLNLERKLYPKISF